MKLGFDASITIDGSSIVTIGDCSLNMSCSEVEVKNRATKKTRYIPGYEVASLDLTVQAGSDPDAPDGAADGYAALYAAFTGHSSVEVGYTSAGGVSYSGDMICTKFEASDPVDGLATANVSLKPSAIEPASGGSGT